MKKNRVVISGANIFAGGTLKIYQDLLRRIHNSGYDEIYDITCFVNDISLFSEIEGTFNYIEIKEVRNNIRKRLYYEYFYYQKWSKGKNIDIWIAMHDLSPSIHAHKRYTYFQSAQLFYKMPKHLIKLDRHEYLRSLMYKYLVGKNIKKLDAVIVQAPWIADKFRQMYGIKNTIVAKAVDEQIKISKQQSINNEKKIYTFSYPSLPRVFKNFEIVCEASKIVEKTEKNFKVLLTINGSENRYASYIRAKYDDCLSIKWIGEIEPSEMTNLYERTDALIFASSLETWGLPISEFSIYDRPILVVDKEYSHFTTLGMDKIVFFDESDPNELANIMKRLISRGNIEYANTNIVEGGDYSWNHMLKTIFNGE